MCTPPAPDALARLVEYTAREPGGPIPDLPRRIRWAKRHRPPHFLLKGELGRALSVSERPHVVPPPRQRRRVSVEYGVPGHRLRQRFEFHQLREHRLPLLPREPLEQVKQAQRILFPCPGKHRR